jgi:hypothetical protein
MAHELRLGLGGHPITNDDAVLLQNNTFEGLSDIVRGLLPSGTTRAILYGCNISTGGGSTSITAGAIYYNGIIYRVDAQSITTVPSIYFVIEEIAGETVIYADTTPRQVHFTLKMKMQAGSGLFLITDIDRIAESFQALLDLTAYATISYVDTLFTTLSATLRDGYDPTFRVNPTTGVLEWSYASPSHPVPSGGIGNTWRSLGIVIGAVVLGTFGIFEVQINTQRSLPVGYLTIGVGLPNYTNVYDIVQFDEEIEDNGSNFSLLRRYVAPIDSAYSFVVEDTVIQCITTVVPFQNLVNGHQITLNFGIFKNNELVPGTQWSTNLNAGGNTSGTNPMVIGSVALPSQNLNINLLANDEITIRHWFVGTTLLPYDPNIAAKQGYLAANARAAYRLSGMNFYNI